MHLLYFRFWYKVLRDMGLVTNDEPVDRLLTQGMVVDHSFRCPEHGYRAKDGVTGLDEAGKPSPGKVRCSACQREVKVALEKMSKSKLNGVSPESVSEAYGADTLRLFCLFAAPPEKDIEWSDTGVAGCFNFLRRVWTLFIQHQERFPLLRGLDGPVDEAHLSPALVSLHRLLHRTIQRVTRDIEQEVQFNTAIAALMEFLNACKALEDMPAPSAGQPADPAARARLQLLRVCLRSMALLLSPFAPHFAEEAWAGLGELGLACEQPWPRFDPAATLEDRITVAVQVNGKLRATLELPRDADRAAMEAAARADERVQKWVEGKAVRKVITVPGRLVNIVVG
jgi:leucyl-tRNA synthetase